MTTEKNKAKFGLKDLQKERGPITFGRLLTSYRFSLDMSQVQLAKKLGLSTANVCDLEKGRKIPSPARAEEIARKLKEHPQYWIEVAVQDLFRKDKLDYKVKVEPNLKVG